MQRQSGSILIYIMAAVFLMGLLVASMTQGSKKSATTVQIDLMTSYLQIDLKTTQEKVIECVRTYSSAVDVNNDGAIDATDNPNTPFPLYGAGADTLANLSSGGVGTAIANVRCPGAPDGQRAVFGAEKSFKMLDDTATYTTTYLTDATEGTYIRITRAAAEDLWTEAISRVNSKISPCAAAAVTAGGTCANGCLYYWILRRATSVIGPEAGCP